MLRYLCPPVRQEEDSSHGFGGTLRRAQANMTWHKCADHWLPTKSHKDLMALHTSREARRCSEATRGRNYYQTIASKYPFTAVACVSCGLPAGGNAPRQRMNRQCWLPHVGSWCSPSETANAQEGTIIRSVDRNPRSTGLWTRRSR